MKRFSVLTFNINGYELLHEIPKDAINPDAEYIYVTDDHNIKSDTWNVIYVDNLSGSVFDKCYQVRFFPFDYVNTDVVVKIDGSMSIESDLTPMVDTFEKGEYDCAVNIHPGRNTMIQEYNAWCNIRNYPLKQAVKCINFLRSNLGYDVENYRGLYQAGFCIQRNDAFNNAWNFTVYDMLRYLATYPDTAERIDQTISSVVLNTEFRYKKVMPIGSDIMNGKYIYLNQHNTNRHLFQDVTIDQYLFNQKVETFK